MGGPETSPRAAYIFSVMFFFVLLSLMTGGDLAWWWWADRKVRTLPSKKLLRALVAAFVLMQLSYLVYFVAMPRTARRVHVPVPYLSIVYIWHLLVLPGWLMLAPLTSAVNWLRRRTTKSVETPATENQLSRRQFLTATAVGAAPLAAVATMGWSLPQLDHFRIRKIELPIPGLPRDLDGLRIAHVSDLHVGRYTHGRILAKVAEATNQLHSDLVLFTGDLIDLSISDLDPALDTLRQIDPKYGLFLVEGNHDLIDDADSFDARTKAAGFNLLIDESATVHVKGRDVQILGTRWGQVEGDRRKAGDHAYAASVAWLTPQRQPDAFPILLAHHPHAFDPAAQANLPLILSGHTHGGLLNLTPNIGMGPAMFRYWSGVYEKPGSKLVVNNGVGNWFPLRVNAPAEIIDLTLRVG